MTQNLIISSTFRHRSLKCSYLCEYPGGFKRYQMVKCLIDQPAAPQKFDKNSDGAYLKVFIIIDNNNSNSIGKFLIQSIIIK